eukprot:scaffold126933_cov39-Tisochrysis_lutea.AAC.2
MDPRPATFGRFITRPSREHSSRCGPVPNALHSTQARPMKATKAAKTSRNLGQASSKGRSESRTQWIPRWMMHTLRGCSAPRIRIRYVSTRAVYSLALV